MTINEKERRRITGLRWTILTLMQRAPIADEIRYQRGHKRILNSEFLNLKSYVCITPTLNLGTSGLCRATRRAHVIASRVSSGSMILSTHKRAAP